MTRRERLAGKVAIVTGAGTDLDGLGNGSAIAREFGRNGCAVVVADRDQEAARRTCEDITEAGGRATSVVGDVAQPADCRTIVARAVAEYGQLDILVNNVGIMVAPGLIYEATEEEWDREMAVNLRSVLLMVKESVRHLEAGGAIVNITSTSGTRPMMTGGVYSVSKGALIPLTLTLAVQLGPKNIRANCISLGPVWTPMGRRSHLKERESAEALQELRTKRRLSTLLKTEGTAVDTANAALFLASDDARWITGQVLVVDGGASLAPRSYSSDAESYGRVG